MEDFSPILKRKRRFGQPEIPSAVQRAELQLNGISGHWTAVFQIPGFNLTKRMWMEVKTQNLHTEKIMACKQMSIKLISLFTVFIVMHQLQPGKRKHSQALVSLNCNKLVNKLVTAIGSKSSEGEQAHTACQLGQAICSLANLSRGALHWSCLQPQAISHPFLLYLASTFFSSLHLIPRC